MTFPRRLPALSLLFLAGCYQSFVLGDAPEPVITIDAGPALDAPAIIEPEPIPEPLPFPEPEPEPEPIPAPIGPDLSLVDESWPASVYYVDRSRCRPNEAHTVLLHAPGACNPILDEFAISWRGECTDGAISQRVHVETLTCEGEPMFAEAPIRTPTSCEPFREGGMFNAFCTGINLPTQLDPTDRFGATRLSIGMAGFNDPSCSDESFVRFEFHVPEACAPAGDVYQRWTQRDDGLLTITRYEDRRCRREIGEEPIEPGPCVERAPGVWGRLLD